VNARDIAEPAVRHPARILRCNPRCHLLLAAQFNVKPQFLFEIALKFVATEEHL
jgi:hypothetical protein